MQEIIGAEEIQNRVHTMAKEIKSDYWGIPLTAVVILKGAFIFAADLIRNLEGLDLNIEFIKASSYKGTKSTGEVLIEQIPNFEGRHLLLIEDIIDSGTTLINLVPQLQKQKLASLKICSLLCKGEQNHTRAEYLGFRIADHFVVGYGLDYDGKYRELNYIAQLENTAPTH